MEYQVLARKWRPINFSDMIGQEHITRTLQNALLNNKTAHAYLFVGPRGIGKTSIARIFAKALNCEKAPIANPCGVCDSCLSISDGNNIDIIEIDGASNNSVNDIRNLREEVLYTPVKCSYKVYIIDEVHMLSNQAWNALLKTLEEPPSHVKFLFATTEAHKILPTVLSRCQRFDLKRIPGNLIVERLSKICNAENVEISKNALRAISKAADGGMRDALSLLDQMIAFHLASDGNEISEEIVFKIFGLTAAEDLYDLVSSMLNDNKPGIILSIHKQSEAGINLEYLFNDILNCLRGIEICMLIQNPDEILEVGSDVIDIYRKLSSNTSLSLIQKLLETLSPIGKVLHDSLNKQIYLETVILKSMRYAQSFSIEELIFKINELKKNGQIDSLSIDIDKKHLNINKSEFSYKRSFKSVTDSNISAFSPPSGATEQSNNQKQTIVSESKEAFTTIKPQIKEEPTPEPVIKKTVLPHNANSVNLIDVNNRLVDKPAVQLKIDSIKVNKKKFDTNFSPKELWNRLINEMDQESIAKPQLKFYMQAAKPESIEKNSLIICYDEEFHSVHSEMVEMEIKLLNDSASKITGIDNFKIKIKHIKGIVAPVRSSVSVDLSELKEKIATNTFIKKTLDLFDGTIVDIRG